MTEMGKIGVIVAWLACGQSRGVTVRTHACLLAVYARDS